MNLKEFIITNWFKLFICSILVTFLGIYSIQTFIVVPAKEKENELRKESLKRQNKINFDVCVSVAENKHDNSLREECKRFNQKFPCLLRRETIKDIEDNYRFDVNECHKKFDK